MKRALFAAAVLATGLAPFPSGAEGVALKPGGPRVEVCFVLDTTGSMGGLIAGAKQKIWSIANRMIDTEPTPQLRLALIGYRDRGDEYVTKRFDLTDDIDLIYQKLHAFQAQGGGDTPESVNQALHEAVSAVSWSQDRDVLKIVFLVGDCPPHMDYQDDVKYPQVCRAAVTKDLIINTVQCGNHGETAPIWQEIAQLSEGEYTAISQTGNMTAIATPMDEKIAAINREIGGTLIAYGSDRDRREVAAKQTLAESAPAPAAADRLKYNLRTRKSVQGGGELLDAVSRGSVALKDVPKKDLPPELRALSDAELAAHVEKLQAERKEMQAELSDLLAQREKYIAEERKRLAKDATGDSFDEKVQETIRTQAKRKGIIYGD